MRISVNPMFGSAKQWPLSLATSSRQRLDWRTMESNNPRFAIFARALLLLLRVDPHVLAAAALDVNVYAVDCSAKLLVAHLVNAAKVDSKF